MGSRDHDRKTMMKFSGSRTMRVSAIGRFLRNLPNIGLVHNYWGFFRDLFFFFKNWRFVNSFHKNNLLFSVSENVYRKSYPYPPYYALPFAQSIRDLNELFGEGTISKRWHTPYCLLAVDAFRYSFGVNTW